MTTPPSLVEGGCLCGAVRYRVHGAPLSSSVCHCRACRLAAGASPVGWIAVARSGYELLAGHPARFRSSPRVWRSFCPRCGTALGYQHDDDPGVIEVTTATLDHPEAFPPTREIWLDHRVAWTPVNAALPHYPRGSDDSLPET
ncbi:MAG TPA: GFA family protein [Albitalea sp.]|nr:GFA family protein [Albitalea sp.]